MKRLSLALTCALAVISLAAAARASIYQWAWVNSSDPTQGKYQSTTMCPDGEGVSAVPNARLDSYDLTQAYLIGANLTDASLQSTTLINADLNGADLSWGILCFADLTGADVTNCKFAGTDFTDANLTGVNFGNAALVNTCFDFANLTGADFTNANVQGTRFTGTTSSGFTAAKLYSTGSYQAKNLETICLQVDNLASWNFSGQDLSRAFFGGSSLQSANLTNANLGGADFETNWAPPGNPFGFAAPSDLTGADTRGATFLNLTSANSTQNLIWPDGSIKGLDLSAGPALVVRNYTADANGNPAHIPIKVHTGMNMGTSGTLQIVLDGNAWGSTISFDPGVPVNLGGTLDVTLAPGVTPASMWGRPVKLFDWTGVTPTGRFTWQDDMGIPYWTIPQNSIQPAWELAPQPEPFFYVWDTSHLYDTGTVTLYLNADTNRDGTLNSLDIDAIYQHMTVAPSTYQGAWPRALAAYNSQYDLNGDGVVNQDDVTYELYHYFLTGYGDADLNKAIDFQDFQILLNHWQNTGPGVGWTQADLNGDGVVDFMDFQIILNYWNPTGWNIAPSEETPEPATLTLLALGALGLVRRKRRPWPVARKP